MLSILKWLRKQEKVKYNIELDANVNVRVVRKTTVSVFN